ncbi:MAG: efflux RND transporter periplasmic adaptor subunit [bacterium]
MKRYLIAIIILLIIGVVLRFTLVNRSKITTVEKFIPAVEVMPVKKMDITRTCTLIGTVMADKTVTVFPETMGRITKILVKEGTNVNKGEKLLAIRNETVGFEFEEAYVTSPINGTIAKMLVDVGSTVAPQTPVAMVVDASKLKVSFNASETDAACFKIGNNVAVIADALPDKKFTGRISEISPVIDPMTKTVGVKAVLNAMSSSLKPGMTARVLINLGERENVLGISEDALIDNSVFVIKPDSTAEKRQVKIGLRGDQWIEIIEGLRENEMVVVLGQQRLAGGEKVNPIVRER